MYVIGKNMRGYAKRTIVLTEDQRRYRKEDTSKGVKPVQAVKRAQVLLEADGAKSLTPMTETNIVEQAGVCLPTVKSVKKAFHDHQCDVEKVVIRKKREIGPREIKITGDVEARLIALCCSAVPEGYAR